MKNYIPLFVTVAVVILLPACKTAYYELKPIPAYKPLDAAKYAKAPYYAVNPVPERASDDPADEKYTFNPPLSIPEKMLMDAFRRNHYNALDYSRCLSIKELDQVQHVIQVLQLEACQHKVEDGYAVTYHLVVSVRPPYSLNTIYASRCFQAFHRMYLPRKAEDDSKTKVFFELPGKDLLNIEYSDELEKKYQPYFEPEYLTPLFDNLFMNPKFRKALEPNRKIRKSR